MRSTRPNGTTAGCWALRTVALAVLTSQSGCSDKSATSPVMAELCASVDQITPGVPFTLGVLFSLQPGWHVYWKFPGDAGLPPTIAWQLPKGWTVGEIQWPLPKRFTEKGPLTTYGYSDSALLMVTVTPPRIMTPSSTVILQAQVNWMACHDECIPGKADLSLGLPVASDISENRPGDEPGNARMHWWQDFLPRANEDAGVTVTAAVTNVDSTGKWANVTLDISTTGSHLTVVDWLPAPTSDCAVKDMARSTGANGSVVSFVLQSYMLPLGEIGTLESLLLCRDSTGKRHGFTLSTAISSE